MLEGHWILVVEPCESDRKLIELAAQSVAPGAEVVFVSGYEQFVPAMASRGSLPTLAILDWFADGGPAACLDTLARLGFLSRLLVVATARDKPMQALDESYGLGISRFVSKRPDDFCFKKKIAEAISESIPGAKKVQPPTSVVA
ncbi:MAG TPA: hypothetical protein VG820_01190 [Fimbriimonadaceae bacterium]|nr:hypothetical protein [Fimbriimonadaceae bacterium]